MSSSSVTRGRAALRSVAPRRPCWCSTAPRSGDRSRGSPRRRGSRARHDDRAIRAAQRQTEPRARQSSCNGSPSGWSSRRPIRSRPGSAPSSSTYGRSGGGAMTVSPTPGPCTASSSAAVSRTVRLTHSSTPRLLSSRNGPSVIRPCDGFRPTRPQHEAGMRIDPPPSLAWANGTIPEATAAADPPLEPPGECSRLQGFRVAPHAIGSVVGRLPNSGLLVRPAMFRPA